MISDDACHDEPCPFDVRLARVPYFVLPKLAIQAMPMDWRKRLEALLQEADETGLQAPNYIVLRDDPAYSRKVPEDEEDPYGALDRVEILRRDPWADYRHATHEDVVALSPEFKPPR